MTREDIEAARTPAGGWTRETLAKWGVAWPPPKGWRAKLENPKMIDRERALEATLKQIDAIKWDAPDEAPDIATELVLYMMEKRRYDTLHTQLVRNVR